MKTLTPDQRMEGFTELESVLGEGGVGGAHLMSFLAGVAHAEKVLASQEQDDEPLSWEEMTDAVNREHDPENKIDVISFMSGAVFAERHHKIRGEDE